MANSRRIGIMAGLLAIASHASAQTASVCPTNDVCFKLNIPQNTASSGTGTIFFQISAPSTYEWVALGQGTGMANSNMFVVYTAGNGNVTLSPRLGTGHSMPNFNSNAKVTLLEGSGVSNGKMVANVKCESCSSWSGGTASFSGSKGNWIYGFRQSGGPKDTTSTSASIAQHSSENAFEWDYASAKGGSSVNPLISSGSSTGSGTAAGGGGVTSCVPRSSSTAGAGSGAGSSNSGGAAATGAPTTTRSGDDGSTSTTRMWGAFSRPTSAPTSWISGHDDDEDERREDKRATSAINYCDESSNSNSNAGTFTPLGRSRSATQTAKIFTAHAALAGLAFIMFFPVGAIMIRIGSFPGVVWVHAAFQVLGYLVFVAAFGLGVYLANNFEVIDEKHPVIGIVVFIALFFQPILGFIHHAQFKKYHTRTIWSHGHLWLGRCAITLGIINGGLGFQLAEELGMGSRSGMIAYSVIAGIVWLVWVVASVFGEMKRRKTINHTPPVYKERVNSEQMERADIPHPEHGRFAPRKDRDPVSPI